MSLPQRPKSARGYLLVMPLLLGVIIGLVAGYSLRPTASAAAGSNPCKATATPVGAARFTPGPKSGAVTPLPGQKPVAPQAHLVLGMIVHPLHTIQSIQAQVNKHNKKYLFYLVPSQVVAHTLPQYGFKPPIHLVSPPKPFPRYAGRPVRKAVVKYNNKLYQVRVAQPLTQGSKGIWSIVTVLPQSVRLGGIGQPGRVVQHQQSLANKNKRYAFYLNPTQVAVKNAPQYGITPPISIVKKAGPFTARSGHPTERVVVKSAGVLYDIYVAQLGKRGPKGVWSVAFIDVHQT